jgi:outer membrane lipase/esterase
VALTPALRSLPPAAQALATFVTQVFNAHLDDIVAQLSAGLPGSSFRRLDAYQLLNAIVADPGAFRLSTVTEPCLTPNLVPFTCTEPDEHLFWDGIHPTKEGHAILAEQAAGVL